MKKLIRVLLGFVLFFGGLFLFTSCLFYHASDASWNTATTLPPENLTGYAGAVCADVLTQLFGKFNYFIPVACMVFGFFLLRAKRWLFFRLMMFCGALAGACWLMGGSSIIQNPMAEEQLSTVEAGGFLGFYLRQWFATPTRLTAVFGWIIVTVLFILGLRVPFFLICRWSSKKVITRVASAKMPKVSLPQLSFPSRIVPEADDTAEDSFEETPPEEQTDVEPVLAIEKNKKSLFGRLRKEKKETPAQRIEPSFERLGLFGENVSAERQADSFETAEPARAVTGRTVSVKKRKEKAVVADAHVLPSRDRDNLDLPSSNLLGAVVASSAPALSKEKMDKISKDLEQVLGEFGVKGKIIGTQCGPVVTLYEFEPAPGIKTSRVIALADDVAMKMCVPSVRIAIIPGMNALGIEMPNPKRETVYIREMVESVKFQGNNGLLPLILGKDIGGVPVFADLAKMPHLLVAGTTGSGKSVAINTMILSLLYRFTPSECRLIMVDPKMVELSVYNRIPHLLTPVVIEPEKAVVALKWAVREMEDRYRSMMHLGVRGIESYNQKVTQAAREGKNITRRVQTGFDPETGKPIFEEQNFDLTPFPFIVIIVDEMADLMGQCGKEVDPLIQRLAQKSRAVGIHLILATQRPSVDVVTGTIKSNFPSRISFQVRSKIDSRTILDEPGAEQLLGRGDMLYMPAGQKPQRVHGPFVSDEDVQAVVNHWEMQAEPDYLDAVITDIEGAASGGSGDKGGTVDVGEGGDLYDQALAIVLRDKKPTTSYIQRQLRIGYNKAADLIDRMEAEGVVSKPNISGKREILVPTDNA